MVNLGQGEEETRGAREENERKKEKKNKGNVAKLYCN